MSEDHNRPIDLSALDPTSDRPRFERMVGSIKSSAAGDLSARRARRDAIIVLASWRRPMLAAAAVVAVVSATILASVQVPDTYVGPTTDGIAEAMGVPEAIAQWIDGEQLPSTTDLFSAF